MNSIAKQNNSMVTKLKQSKIVESLNKHKYLHMLAIPCIIYFIVFKYLPMYGIIVAFKDYKGMGGFWGIIDSEWVGIKNFQIFFKSMYFGRLLKNTLLLSVYNLIFVFPAPIILAILINEVKGKYFKKTVQTISYMPHFLSWVVCAGLIMQILAPSGGPVNAILEKFGVEPIYFVNDISWFRTVLVGSSLWKEIGWGSIVYLAAITGIDQEMYEAATIDGAKVWHKIWYITLPSIAEIIAIMLILKMGSMLDGHFEQVFNLYNPAVYEVADNFETYVYRQGLIEAKYSYSSAVGFSKSIVALFLVVVANKAAKKLGTEGLW